MIKIIIVWVVAFIALVLLMANLKKETTDFHGIADAREIILNNSNSVEVKKIHVLPGQAIKKGELVVELYCQELEEKIGEIKQDLAELKAQKVSDSGSIKSEISQLRAERAEKISEFNTLIAELETKLKLNNELASELKSINSKNAQNRSVTNNLQTRIQGLKNDLKLQTQEIDIQIQQLQSRSKSPINLQVKSYEDELAKLENEIKKIQMISPIDGVIGSVNFKEGESVSSFTPIVTLHPKSPSYVNGYINENVYNRVEIGQSVEVISLTGRGKRIKGTVVGVGSRMIEFPLRMWKRPDLSMWGREVQIKIPEVNDLLLGEKVLVRLLNVNINEKQQ